MKYIYTLCWPFVMTELIPEVKISIASCNLKVQISMHDCPKMKLITTWGFMNRCLLYIMTKFILDIAYLWYIAAAWWHTMHGNWDWNLIAHHTSSLTLNQGDIITFACIKTKLGWVYNTEDSKEFLRSCSSLATHLTPPLNIISSNPAPDWCLWYLQMIIWYLLD